MSDYRISFDKAELDIDLIHAFLSGSYWAKGIPRHIVETSIRNSFCAAVFAKDEAGQDEQVGFARLITDGVSRQPFAYPTLHIRRRPADLFSYAFEDFEVQDYQCHAAIKAPVAV